jgi:hypothetical protein
MEELTLGHLVLRYFRLVILQTIDYVRGRSLFQSRNEPEGRV